MGHKAVDCKLPKENHDANMVDDIANNTTELGFTVVLSEVNLVREWLIDTSATTML